MRLIVMILTILAAPIAANADEAQQWPVTFRSVIELSSLQYETPTAPAPDCQSLVGVSQQRCEGTLPDFYIGQETSSSFADRIEVLAGAGLLLREDGNGGREVKSGFWGSFRGIDFEVDVELDVDINNLKRTDGRLGVKINF